MKSFWEDLYLASPVLVQNLLINIKGSLIAQTNRGGNYENYLREVLARGKWSKEEFRSYQVECLKRVLVSASKNVPYYRKIFDDIRFNPTEVRSVDVIKRLPFLEKNTIRQNSVDFLDKTVSRRGLLSLYTTGSTGTPLKVYASKDVRQRNYAFFDAYLLSLGIDPKAKKATLGGRLVCNPEQRKPPFWRYIRAQNNMMFSSYHLTQQNLPYYIDEMAKFNPELIDSYPSSIYIVAKFLVENGGAGLIKPKGIVTSAATLFEEQRELIEEAFKCKVYDQYGAAEMCIFVGQCIYGNYHYRPDFGIVEVIKGSTEVSPGEVGEIVCTGFINQVMPLIRYRIGDLGVLSQNTCPCGLDTPIFAQIVGRVDDTILTPDGRFVGRMSPVLKGFPVKEAQYVQKSLSEILIRIVKDMSYHDETTNDIVKEVRKRLGSAISINVEFVDNIERGPGGKLRTVISEIRKDLSPHDALIKLS